MSTPTAIQIDALLDFLEEHRDLARGSLRSVEGRALSHRLWDEICTTLNSMGGCIQTKTQWQKVWTDKKYLAKKAAAAAPRSVFITGVGLSMAPPLSQMELKVISIMGDGFGGPQSTAREPFNEDLREVSTVLSTQSLHRGDIPQQYDNLQVEAHSTELESSHPQPGPSQNQEIPARIVHTQITSTRERRFRRQSTPRVDGSTMDVREKRFQIEERRERREEKTNEELAGIRVALVELCGILRGHKFQRKI